MTADTDIYEGETLALKDLRLPQRSYGTCGDLTPYVPSPTSRKGRRCLPHVVHANETLAGIALKYDLTVEDLRRTNSFLWTSSSVWTGQILKIPVPYREDGDEEATGVLNEVPPVKRNSLASVKETTPSEFWTKVDSSIEQTKRVSRNLKEAAAAKEKKNNSSCKEDQLIC